MKVLSVEYSWCTHYVELGHAYCTTCDVLCCVIGLFILLSLYCFWLVFGQFWSNYSVGQFNGKSQSPYLNESISQYNEERL